MASIPLPALDLKPPAPQPGPMQLYGQVQQMQNAGLQNQVMQGQVQQQQIALQDQKAMTQAMQQWDGKDINSLVPLVVKNGASANAVMGLKGKVLEQQKTLSDIAAQDATTGSKNLQSMKDKNGIIGGQLAALDSVPDDQLGQAVQSTAQQLSQQGLLDPQHAQIAQQLATLPPAQIRTQLDVMKKGLMSQSDQIDAAAKQAQALKNTAQAGEATAHTNQINQQTMFGPTGPAAEGKYRFILQKLAANQQVSPDEMNFARSFEASQAKRTNTSDSLGVVSSNTSAPAGLSAVSRRPLPSSNLQSGVGVGATSPTSLKNDTVDLIGQYRADPMLMSRMLYKHPEMIGLIQSRYPGWDQTEYQAKNQMVKSFTSGPESRSINAIGTALGHAGELRDAIDALGNGNDGINALRKIGNQIGVQVGSDKVTAFNTIVHRLAPEITAAYVQGGGGEGERTAAAEDFSPSMSRQQLLSNWGETVKLLQSKIAQQKQQWDTTYRPNSPQDQFSTRFLSPVAQGTLQRYNSEAQGPSTAPAAPQTHSFSLGAWQRANPKGDAAAAKAAAQAQGYQVVQ